MKKTMGVVVLFLLFISVSVYAFEQIDTTESVAQEPPTPFIPPQLNAFYNADLSKLLFSQSEVLLYETDSTQIFFGHQNSENQTMTYVYNISCENCDTTITFDTFWEDSLEPGKKRAAGLFIQTNESKLGYNVYTFSITNNQTKELVDSTTLTVQVISKSFWKQFIHNFVDVFVFWK